MAKASVRVRRSKTVTTARTKVRKDGKGKRGNPNKCPVCGKFMGNGKSQS